MDSQALVQLASLLSDGDPAVVAHMAGELDESESYELAECLQDTAHLVHVDWKAPSDDTLMQLNSLSGDQLSAGASYARLLAQYQETNCAIAQHLDEPLPTAELLDVTRTAGFELESLDLGSDSYALILIPTAQLDTAYRLAEACDVAFYFRWRRTVVAREQAAATAPPPPSPSPGAPSSRRWWKRKR